jgi:AMP-binding enzyme
MALLIYSSGTTGRPREVMREHSNLDALCHSIIEASLTGDDHGVSILPQPCSYRARRWIPVGRSRSGAGRRAVNLGIGGRAGALLHSRSQPGAPRPPISPCCRRSSTVTELHDAQLSTRALRDLEAARTVRNVLSRRSPTA